MPTNSHADMRDADAARRPMAPQMPYLPPPIGGSEHGGRGTECICVIYIFSGVALRWRPSGACLLLGGASVAVPASDWTERHRSRIAAALLSHPTHPGDVSFRGLVSRSLGGVGPASRVHMVCVAERPPMPYDDNHLSSPYIYHNP